MRVLRFMLLVYANRKSATKVVKVSLLLPSTQLNYVKGCEFLPNGALAMPLHVEIKDAAGFAKMGVL